MNLDLTPCDYGDEVNYLWAMKQKMLFLSHIHTQAHTRRHNTFTQKQGDMGNRDTLI